MASGWEIYDISGQVHLFNKRSNRLLQLRLGTEPFKIDYTVGFDFEQLTEENKITGDNFFSDLFNRGYNLELSKPIAQIPLSATPSPDLSKPIAQIPLTSSPLPTLPHVPAVVAAPSCNVPAVVADLSSHIPAVVAAPPKVPAVIAPPSSNVPALVTAPSSNVPAVVAPLSSNVPAVVTAPSSNIPAVVAPPSSNVPAVVVAPSANVPAVVAVPSPDAGIDYRKHIVSKGTGNPDEWCQKSVDLMRSDQISCTLSHVESPSLFWVRLFTSNLETIEEDLNYDLDMDKKALSNPRVGDYCVAPIESNVENMHRAKILEIKDNSLGTSFAKILYIDSGKVDWVATKALEELPRRYRHYLRQACPCALSELVPVGGCWSDDVINSFRELCKADDGYELYVTGLDQSDSPDINTVTLYRVKKEEGAKKETILISLIKSAIGQVRRGERVIPATAFEKEGGEPIGGLNPPDETEGWRCTVRVLANNTTDDVEEESQEQMERRAAEREALRVSLAERAASTLTPGEISAISLSDQSLDNEGRITFRVCEVISPSNFYIQLVGPNGKTDVLDALSTEMNTFYSNPINQVLLPRSGPSQFAVALSTRDGVTGFRRVIIKEWKMPPGTEGTSKDIRVHSIVTAIFADYGYCQRLQGKDIFVLDKRFCNIPAQATYCRLYGCRPSAPTADGRWDQNSIDIFKQLTTNGKPLLKGVICSEKQPYDLVIYEVSSGQCINQRLVDSTLAISEFQFS